MRDEDIDIVELILQQLPKKNILDDQIFLYMKAHKTNCNLFIYDRFKKETTFFNTILKSLMCDLSAEIVRVLGRKKLI